MSIFQLSYEREIGVDLIEPTTGLEIILITSGVVGAIANAMALVRISSHRSLLQKHFASLTLFTFNLMHSLKSLLLAIRGVIIFKDKLPELYFIHKLIVTGQLFSFVLVILEKIFYLKLSSVNRILREHSQRDYFHVILFLVVLAGVANLFANIYLKSLESIIYMLTALTTLVYIFLLVQIYFHKSSNPIKIVSRKRTLVYASVIFGFYSVLFASNAFSHSAWFNRSKSMNLVSFNYLFLVLITVNHVHLLTDPLIFYICHTKVKKSWQKNCTNALYQIQLFCFCKKRDTDYTVSRKVYIIPYNSRANSIHSRGNSIDSSMSKHSNVSLHCNRDGSQTNLKH